MKTIKELEKYSLRTKYRTHYVIRIQTLKDVLKLIDELEEKRISDGVEGWTSFEDKDWKKLKARIEG